MYHDLYLKKKKKNFNDAAETNLGSELFVWKLELNLTGDLSEKLFCDHSFPSDVLVNEWSIYIYIFC